MLKIIKKVIKYPCYCCKKSIKGETVPRKNCRACDGTGLFKENFYYHIYIGKDGKKYCIDGDSVK